MPAARLVVLPLPLHLNLPQGMWGTHGSDAVDGAMRIAPLSTPLPVTPSTQPVVSDGIDASIVGSTGCGAPAGARTWCDRQSVDMNQSACGYLAK